MAGTVSNVETAIDCLEKTIGDPARGLPEEVFLFISRITPLVNVDLLIKNEEGHVLLTWRDDGLYSPGWHVPGGILRCRETLTDRLHTVAANELGADITFDPKPLAVNELIEPVRKVRAHFVSFLYQCTLRRGPDEAWRFRQGSPAPGAWAWHSRCPDNLIACHEVYRGYFT